MPEIKTYTNTQDLSASPVEGAAMSMFRLGRAQQAAYNEAGAGIKSGLNSAEQHIAMSETTKAATDIAKTNMQLFQDWETVKKNADPNDPDTAKKFMEEHLQPTLDKLNGDYLTPQAQDLVAKSRSSMMTEWFERTSSDQAHMQAQAAQGAVDLVARSASANAQADPTSIDRQLELLQTNIGAVGASHNLNRAQIDDLVSKASEQATYASFLGKIDRNPGAAYEELQKPNAGGGFLSGEQVSELQTKAVGEQRMQIAMAREMQTQQHEDNRRAAEGTVSKIIDTMIGPDGQLRVSPQMFQALKGGEFQTPEGGEVQKSTFEFLHSMMRAESESPQSNPDVKGDILRRATLSPDDPNRLTQQELLKAAGSGDLVPKDVETAGKYLTMSAGQGTRTEMSDVRNVINSLKPAITGTVGLGIPDGEASQRFAAFQSSAMQAYAEGRANGKTHRELTDPASPDYIGNSAQSFILNSDQKMQALTSTMQNGATIYRGAVKEGGSQQQPVAVQSPKDAAKLPPGTWFKTPDGRTIQRQ